ncbi:GlxA family transcriptional regulator [Roseovarius sp. THAF27]|uniref:GlxA family transcriptional regulator n=1 Tax=Roseovarius sp. THAF27 TaxID=2587850 RepID=UPI001C12BAB1|nr:GlxA family transcriptional regulator [Roseovarius sp. THAF27]
MRFIIFGFSCRVVFVFGKARSKNDNKIEYLGHNEECRSHFSGLEHGMSNIKVRSNRPGGGRQKFRVAILPLDNFTLNAFSGFVDALRLAADEGGRSRQIECGWEIAGHRTVQASCGLTVTPQGPPPDPAEVDYIAVSAGNDYRDRRQPAWLDAYLKDAADKGVTLIGLCTGTFNIARAGLMKGRPACVHWNVREEFREQFPGIETVSDRIFLDARDRITCAGSTGASDLALYLVSRHCGAERAQQSLRHMILNRQRESSAPQPQFVTDMSGVKDADVRHAIGLMEQTLNAPISVDDLAKKVGLSTRQLSRRFLECVGQPPSRFYRVMRLRYGAWRLLHTTDRVGQVAADLGFADSSHFSREFASLFNMTPKSYRAASSQLSQTIDGG